MAHPPPPLLGVLLRFETAALPSSGGRAKLHTAAGALLPSTLVDCSDMTIWNDGSSACKLLAAVAAVRKQSGIWNVQSELRGCAHEVCLSFYVLNCKAREALHWNTPESRQDLTNLWPVRSFSKLEPGSILIHA